MLLTECVEISESAVQVPLLLSAFTDWPLLDSRNPDNERSQPNRQPDSLQPDGNAASSGQSQQLCAAQYPQAATRASALPQLVHGHTVGRAEGWDFPEAGEDCRSLINYPLKKEKVLFVETITRATVTEVVHSSIYFT